MERAGQFPQVSIRAEVGVELGDIPRPVPIHFGVRACNHSQEMGIRTHGKPLHRRWSPQH